MNTSIKAADSVIVFDLDDTLYAEQDYKISGILAVCRQIAQLYPQQFSEPELLSQANSQSSSWLDNLCSYCGLNSSEKQTLLWTYRLHDPDIHPLMPSEKIISLVKHFFASAIISDGRSLTQRLKINALGLGSCFDHILISEAFTSEKPHPERFNFIEAQYPDKQWIYIGDNPAKDFVTPNKQGWLTIGIRSRKQNIHPQDIETPPEYQPQLWLTDLTELDPIFTDFKSG